VRIEIHQATLVDRGQFVDKASGGGTLNECRHYTVDVDQGPLLSTQTGLGALVIVFQIQLNYIPNSLGCLFRILQR
jgi:hypothetical protein